MTMAPILRHHPILICEGAGGKGTTRCCGRPHELGQLRLAWQANDNGNCGRPTNSVFLDVRRFGGLEFSRAHQHDGGDEAGQRVAD